MGWVNATDTTGMAEGETKKVTVEGNDILFANVGGKYYAIADKCPHMGGSLSEGSLKGGIITCPRHGSQYDVKTGKAIGDAKILLLKIKVKDAKSYRTRVEGKTISVELE